MNLDFVDDAGEALMKLAPLQSSRVAWPPTQMLA
jgi:hypothetical protein